MEIPFTVKDSQTSGTLFHLETFQAEDGAIMIRGAYRADDLVTPGQTLVFTEHDGTPLELSASAATTDGHVDLGPEGASDFAIAFGLD
jgi:hypothetical protein